MSSGAPRCPPPPPHPHSWVCSSFTLSQAQEGVSKAGAGQSPSLLTPGLPPAGQTAARLAAVLQVCVSYLFIFSMASASSLGPRGVRRLRTLAFEHPGVAHQSRGRGPSVPRPCGLSLRGHRRLCGRRRLDSAPAGVPVDGGVRTSGRRGRPAAAGLARRFAFHPSSLPLNPL